MAVRTISTKLQITGEAEYKNSIKSVNSELNMLKSELEATESAYRHNADSMEALTAKGEVLQKQYDAQREKVELISNQLQNAKEAEARYADEIQNTSETIAKKQEELDALKASTDDTSEAEAKLTEEIENLGKQLNASEATHGKAEQAVNKYQTQLNKAQVELDKFDDKLADNATALENVEKPTEDAADSISELGKNAGGAGNPVADFAQKAGELFTLAGIAAILKEVGEAAYKMAMEIQEAQAIIVSGTGATGAALDKLTSSYMTVLGNVDSGSDKVARAVADVNTRLGLQGAQLTEVSRLLVEYADINGADVAKSVENVSKVMKKWSIDAADTELLLDKITVASQASGMSVDTLTEYLVSNYAQFSQLGYTLDETISLLATLEQSGANTSSVMLGLRTAITKISDEGGDIGAGFEAVTGKIKNAATEAEALSVASEYFGTRAGQEMVYVIRQAGFELDGYVDVLAESSGKMQESADTADTWKDKWTQAINGIKTSLFEIKEYFERVSGAEAEANVQSTKTLAELNAKYEDNAGKIQASAILADNYAKRLKELETQGLNSAESQQEYADVVARLNYIMPELNLQLEEQTGLVIGGTDAIIANTEAWRENAVMQAMQEEYAERTRAYAEALLELETKTLDYAAAQQTALEADTAYQMVLTQTDEALAALGTGYSRNTNDVSEWAAALMGSGEIGESLVEQYYDMGDAASAAASYEAELKREVDLCSEGVAGQEAKMASLDAVMESLGVTTKDLEGKQGELSENGTVSLETIETKIRDLQTEYDAAYEAAYKSIDSQIGLFEDMTLSGTTSIGDLISAMDSQIAYMDTYAANLKLAGELGMDKGLILELSDGSKESAEILAGIVEDGGENMDKLNENFRKVEEGKKDFAAEMTELQGDFKNRLDEMQGELNAAVAEMDVYDDTYAAGVNTINGLIYGFRSKYSEYTRMVAQAGYDAAAAYRLATRQASPSKIFEQIGAYDVEGLMRGVKSKEDELKAAYSGLGDITLGSVSENAMMGNDYSGYLGGILSALTAPAAVQSDGERTVTLVVNLDNRELARAQYPELKDIERLRGVDLVEQGG